MTARKWRDGQAVDVACALIVAHPKKYRRERRYTSDFDIDGKSLAADVARVLDALPETIPEAEPERVRPVFGSTPVGFTPGG